MGIYVCGDVTLDNYEYLGDYEDAYTRFIGGGNPDGEQVARQLPRLDRRSRYRIVARHFGGAYLIARHLAVTLTTWRLEDKEARVRKEDLNTIEPWAHVFKALEELRSALATEPHKNQDFLQLFYRLQQDSDKSYRVSPHGFEGYTFPNTLANHQFSFRYVAGKDAVGSMGEGPIPVLEDGAGDLVVFNDGGMRTRCSDVDWVDRNFAASGNEKRKLWAVVKSHAANLPKALRCIPSESPNRFFLWLNRNLVEAEHHAGSQIETRSNRVVVILDSADLRRTGIPISLSLSWERSLADLVHHIERGDVLKDELPSHVVVTFDFDAAAYLNVNPAGSGYKVNEVVAVFSTNKSEGEFREQFHGSMPGSQTAFTSVFCALLYDVLEEQKWALDLSREHVLIEKMLTYSLIAKRKLLECGFAPISPKSILKPYSNAEGDTCLLARVFYHESVFSLPKHENADPQLPESHPGNPIFPTAPKSPVFGNPWKREAPGSDKQLKKDLREQGLSAVRLPQPSLTELHGDGDMFSITSAQLEDDDLVQYVEKGTTEHNIPICSIGKIKLISKKEIESLRIIRRLINSYLTSGHDYDSPLGIAVFGHPGSGKGFAVKSILDTLSQQAREALGEKKLGDEKLIECNLSGLSRPEEIAHYFQIARDRRLQGHVPILFFDEFDCTVDQQPYFWLKYFLAPLQDGKFLSGQHAHPIGKSIFVFAGGTSQSFEAFKEKVVREPSDDPSNSAGGAKRNERSKKEGTSGTNAHGDDTALANIKGKDFLSRLQGHIDIEGLSPSQHPEKTGSQRAPHEKLAALRRAILLRELLKLRAHSIVSKSGSAETVRIDYGVVLAFVHETGFKHGVRSMEAIIRMSALRDQSKFTPECLPTTEQLKMHVGDKDAFYMRAFSGQSDANP